MQKTQKQLLLQHCSLSQKWAFETNLQSSPLTACCSVSQRFGLAFQHYLLTKTHSGRLYIGLTVRVFTGSLSQLQFYY